MNRALSVLLAGCLLAVEGSSGMAAEIGYLEEFALAADRDGAAWPS